MKITAPSEAGEESPVTSFVQLERYNAIRLVQIVHASLSSLSKVIRGTALLDAEVQALAGALLKQEVSGVCEEELSLEITLNRCQGRSYEERPCFLRPLIKASDFLLN